MSATEELEYRCKCGHFEAEHHEPGGCEGCDNGGRADEDICEAYVSDPNWPEPLATTNAQ